MATYLKGILGRFSGKLGTIIGSRWKGIDYMRSLPTPYTGPITEAQEAQQARFSLVRKFLKPMNNLNQKSFTDASGMTGGNSAFAYNINNAVTGVYPNLSIDYTRVLVANGDLPNADSASVASANGSIKFDWIDDFSDDTAKPGDKAVLVAYCESLNRCIFSLNGGKRSDASGSLLVKAFLGKDVHTWIAFISENGKKASASFYTGMLQVS